MENLALLINELIKHPNETEWLEFKVNNSDPKLIGKDISALANSAAYHERSNAYMIWGIDDKDHSIIGTDFDFKSKRIGNEELENWLRHQLSNNANFEFQRIVMDNNTVILLIIYKAISYTVKFENIDYIRVGSYTKTLKDHPALEAQLWDRIRLSHYEDLTAKKDLELEDALSFIDYPVYFRMMYLDVPQSIEGLAFYLLEERIIVKQDNGLYSISNLGAILFAKRLFHFPNVARKAVRFVQYKGNSRVDMIREHVGAKGYASGLQGLIKFIENLIPTNEVIKSALRKTVPEYPIVAIREAIANALIHQDLTITGTGPTIELFSDRIEITNPGCPLVDIQRIVDIPPKSRNEKLAFLMRRLKLCEELGTGWDKIITYCEIYQLPAPKIELYEENTKVTLFAHIDFKDMTQEDKLRAVYWHACLKKVNQEYMNNSSLRTRFGLPETNSSTVSMSNLIKLALNARLIKPYDPDTAPKYMKYIPFWA